MAAAGGEHSTNILQAQEGMQAGSESKGIHIWENSRIPASLQPTVAFLWADEMDFGGRPFGDDSDFELINDLSFTGQLVFSHGITSVAVNGKGRTELKEVFQAIGRPMRRLGRRAGSYEGGEYSGEMSG